MSNLRGVLAISLFIAAVFYGLRVFRMISDKFEFGQCLRILASGGKVKTRRSREIKR
jgi:hypothetical protein